jgi:D-tyrosyl-tRNA(Tyr) deacylase
MRLVIQRVSEASVKVDGEMVGCIDGGLLVLVGIEPADILEDMQWLCKKLVQLRIFNDAAGVPDLSLMDTGGDILLISQFTLFASTKKGNRPGYSRAAGPDVAKPLYEKMIVQLGIELGRPVEKGIFGADMKVSLVNDGPITILMDSKQKDF